MRVRPKIIQVRCQEIKSLIPHIIVVLDEQERVCIEAGGEQSDDAGKRLLAAPAPFELIRHSDPAVGTLNDLLLEEP